MSPDTAPTGRSRRPRGSAATPTAFDEPTPTTGQNFAILTDLGKVGQGFTTTAAGTHTIRLSANVRYWGNVSQTIKVKVDGATRLHVEGRGHREGEGGGVDRGPDPLGHRDAGPAYALDRRAERSQQPGGTRDETDLHRLGLDHRPAPRLGRRAAAQSRVRRLRAGPRDVVLQPARGRRARLSADRQDHDQPASSSTAGWSSSPTGRPSPSSKSTRPRRSGSTVSTRARSGSPARPIR